MRMIIIIIIRSARSLVYVMNFCGRKIAKKDFRKTLSQQNMSQTVAH